MSTPHFPELILCSLDMHDENPLIFHSPSPQGSTAYILGGFTLRSEDLLVPPQTSKPDKT